MHRISLESEPEIDVTKVEVNNPELEPFIHHELEQYKDCIAKHEWDSGIITNVPEFEIKFIPGEHPLKDGFMSKEYWTNTHQRKEMQRQIDGMLAYDGIEICKHPEFVSSIFCVSKKTGDPDSFDYRKLNQITQKHFHILDITNYSSVKIKSLECH